MLFAESEFINSSLSPLSSTLSLPSSTFIPLSYEFIRTHYAAQPLQNLILTTSVNLPNIALKNMNQFETDQNDLTNHSDITRLQQAAGRTNQNLQSLTTHRKGLLDYYNTKQTEKSGSKVQVISNIDNQLWPSHKSIPEDVKEEGQWYHDRNDIDYNAEELRIESTLRSPHVKHHELLDLNDTISHISEVTNDSTLYPFTVKLGFGIGLLLLFLILIIFRIIMHREWLRQNSQSENDINHNSYEWNFCLHCGLIGKTTMKKMTNVSIGRLQNYYKDENDRYHKRIHDVENLWLLEKSRLVVFHEMKLGSGAFCNVYKGAIEGLAPICKVNPSLTTYGTFKDCMCAIKMLSSTADDSAYADFMQEIKFMKSLKYHPHLVSMLGISIDDNGNIMLLIEYCDLGDLLHLVRNKKGEIIMNYTNEHSKLRIKDLISFSWQISNGLEYLSNIGCVHRDIAARNVLVNATNICKIADFGLCRLSESFIYTGHGRRLPLKWMAPESLRSYEYSIKTDVWSYGVLLYEVFSFGEVPYAPLQATEILDFLNSGARLRQPQYCPINVYTLMLQCWQDEPSLRPTFTEICSILSVILEDNFQNYGYISAINGNGNSINID
ncbi:unnamed protein product [Cercopithifilaria johnstoni]|uniref:Protein kinase domain-containing protein n=1 Tax=Cercopithifilaria johnstoni TaxID=2874296 RepID=A0A8J2LZE6_9BILA|nr:unnamed protein product [Cercopithifilaria johnstoni]